MPSVDSLKLPTPDRRRPTSILEIAPLTTRQDLEIENTIAPESEPEQAGPVQVELKHAGTRHWGSLQDHADHLLAESPGGRVSTPHPEDRREGYTWDAPKVIVYSAVPEYHPRRPSMREPKGTAQGRAHDPLPGAAEVVVSPDGPPRSISPLKRLSTSSSTDIRQVSRMNTGISSIDSMQRNSRRGLPDLRIFDYQPQTPEEQRPVEETPRKPITKAGRNLTFTLTSALKRSGTDEKKQKRATFFDEQGKDEPRSDIPKKNGLKGGLKNRRKLDQTEAMKLTLPLNMPDLPARSRSPIEMDKLKDIAPGRPRSPKTPSVRDTPPAWLNTHPIAASPTILEASSPASAGMQLGHGLLPGSDELQSSIPTSKKGRSQCNPPRPRFKRGRSCTSDSSLARTPDGTIALATSPADIPNFRPTEELKQLGKKRSRRWRWSTNETAESPSVDASHTAFSFSRFFGIGLQRTVSTPPIMIYEPSPALSAPVQQPHVVPKVAWRRPLSPKRSPKRQIKDPIATMPLPPTFVPPGLQRVPTPPIFDQNGEVKGKLADFFFTNPLLHERKPKPSPNIPGRVWDSDALLMSQETNITPDSEEDAEAPEGRSPPLDAAELSSFAFGYGGAHNQNSPWGFGSAAVAPASLYPKSAPVTGHPGDYFRVQLSDSTTPDAEMTVEDRAKFEWLIPEHLPNSPLCPLHEKYHGPSEGICVYHGRRKSDWSGKGRGEGNRENPSDQDERSGSYDSDMLDAEGLWMRDKKRSFINLSSP